MHFVFRIEPREIAGGWVMEDDPIKYNSTFKFYKH